MTDDRLLLKDLIDEPSVRALVTAVAAVQPGTPIETVVAEVFDDEWFKRELKQRIRHVAVMLYRHLPADYPTAIAVLRAAATQVEELGFSAMVFNDFVEEYGVDDPDTSLPALEQFTTLVSAEFAVRPFINRYPDRLFGQLLAWAGSDDWRVRRLASEGSRPRLPWGRGLPSLKQDPSPLLPILGALRTDPSEDVRRSVANSLNDISKDHPEFVVEVLSAWQDGSTEFAALTKHALRTLLKQGHPGALELLGFSPDPEVEVRAIQVEPASTPIGGAVQLHFEVHSTGRQAQQLMIDYTVIFQNASGTGSRKVFKGKVIELVPGDYLEMRRKISLQPLSTRSIFPGIHSVEVQVNGTVLDRVEFEVTV